MLKHELVNSLLYSHEVLFLRQCGIDSYDRLVKFFDSYLFVDDELPTTKTKREVIILLFWSCRMYFSRYTHEVCSSIDSSYSIAETRNKCLDASTEMPTAALSSCFRRR